ncbi:MAG: DAK2 domain-containing protein [Actinomycetota bacterium]|nr:DAK2 domain-containing protein [Actinomycetota bacterium]MDA3011839.1 DAK2 domain-containing protein [Actinomycetota bacterium]MDA3024750.1 DAK2 domain-containing protein [Actinomycetota bacterium]
MTAPVLAPDEPSERFDADRLRRTVVTFRDAVKAHAPRINRLNVYPVPDGDTGTNMARTLDAVVAELESADLGIEPTCQAISHGSLMGARGNSGVILSQILRGMSGRLSKAATHTATEVAEALSAASTSAYQAVVKPIEGTILTVVREASDAARQAAADGEGLAGVLRAARDAGRSALDRTPEMLPVLKDAGVVDAGGAGFLLLLDAALNVVDGEPIPTPEDSIGGDATELPQFDVSSLSSPDDHAELSVADLRYEVMYFLHLDDDRIGEFKNDWAEIGDSIVVVGGDGLWNCHVHTNDIGAAIEVAIDLGGRPKQIRVTDLFEEVAEQHAAHGSRGDSADSEWSSLPRVTTAVVAVCSGSGLEELFGQLGVQGIVTGGQTLNPSTAELLDAVTRVNADQVIVLPNNKNIIPVAEQLDGLTSKVVQVVATRSMPEALAALVVYDPEASCDVNGASMASAIGAMTTGEVTKAVRDASTEAGPVTIGDWIGLVRGEGIVAVSGSSEGAAIGLLQSIVSDDREIVTIIEGAEATPSATEAIRAWLAVERSDVQVECHRGGQPLYPYLFGVE